LVYLGSFQDSPILKEATVALSSISPGSLLDSPLASTLTTNTNQAVSTGARLSTSQALSTGTRLNTTSARNGSTSDSALDPLTQDLITLLKALAYGDIAGAKTDLAKYKADLKAETTAATANNSATDVVSLDKGLASGSTAGTQAVNQSDTLVTRISNSLSSGSIQGALKDLTGYLVQTGHGSGGLINTVA
jgi:hypothetical protein